MHLPAIRALKIRVFNDCDRRIRAAANVITHADRRWMQPTNPQVTPKGRIGDMKDENRIQ